MIIKIMEKYKIYDNRVELVKNIDKVHEEMIKLLVLINKTEKSLNYAIKSENSVRISTLLHELYLFNTLYRKSKETHEYLLNRLIEYKI